MQDPEGAWNFGPEGDAPIEVRLRDFGVYRTLALEGTLGTADAYLDGRWDCDDLVGLFRLLTRNPRVMDGCDGWVARALRGWSVLRHALRRNTVAGSRRNISAHYDLGDDFFGLFLDETMTYSAGVFLDPNATLADASREKYDRICRKLRLRPGDHVLEIGSGWGGFALHAAGEYGCSLTTTTVSRRQHAYATERVRQAGLAGRVAVLLQDYRDLQGAFDHVVSIEMIESVGHAYLPTFFRQCSRLTKPTGMVALQAITIPDSRYDTYRRSVDFIQKHVFPGGCLPSLGALGDAVGRGGDLRFVHLKDFGDQYAETLARWRERFEANLSAVRALGYDERFVRMWRYYLCYCEAGFRENQIGVAQIVLAKPECDRSLWRIA